MIISSLRGILLFLFMLIGVGMLFPLKGVVAQQAGEVGGSEDSTRLIEFQQAPFALEGHTYVPARELAEYLGIDIRWDQKKNLIILNDGRVAFSFKRLTDQPGLGVIDPLGSEFYQHEAREETDEMIWPYRLEEERLFLPLRHMARVFNWHLGWDAQLRRVSLSINNFEGEPLTLCFSVEEPYSRKLWPAPKRIAYLTFDDGPSQIVTPLILDILREENVKATFFVVGQQINKHPEILQRIYKEGHSIGNHTYSHQPAVLFSGVGPFMQEVHKTNELIYTSIGERPSIFRMPYGTNFPEWSAHRRALEKGGYRHVSWNVNSFDANRINVPAERIVNTVRQQVAGRNVVIILFHDLASITTAEALPQVIQFLKGQGYFIWPM